MESKVIVICGNIVHSTDTEAMVLMTCQCIGIKNNKILFLVSRDQLKQVLLENKIENHHIVYLNESQFLMPGFVDTHLHAPQYPNCGKGLDKTLLDWLDTYTFPTEAKFKDLKFAEMAYKKAVRRVLLNGTTTACYYATIDTDATLVLCDVIDKLGQRAYVGKVNMDQNSPEFYTEPSADLSVAETKRYIESVKSRKYKHITPIITPRFAITCSEDLMTRLAQLAQENNLPIQTHVCETKGEIAAVQEIFPNYDSYTELYDKMGLLTDKTVLAHGIYFTEKEIEIVKKRESSVSHCPNSNLSIRSGVLDVKNLLNKDIKVGLGTDISGGYHPSMLDAIRTAVYASNIKAMENVATGYEAISVREAFRMATLGGAKAMGLEKKIGNFEVGKEFDAIIVDPCTQDSVVDVFADEKLQDIVEKYLFTGDDRNIVSIFVGGKIVYRKQGYIEDGKTDSEQHRNGISRLFAEF